MTDYKYYKVKLSECDDDDSERELYDTFECPSDITDINEILEWIEDNECISIDEVIEEVNKYDQYKITFCSNPEYPPVIVEDKTFSVPNDITSIDDVNEYLTELTGIFIIRNCGKLLK